MKKSLKVASLAALTAATLALPAAASMMRDPGAKCAPKAGKMHKGAKKCAPKAKCGPKYAPKK